MQDTVYNEIELDILDMSKKTSAKNTEKNIKPDTKKSGKEEENIVEESVENTSDTDVEEDVVEEEQTQELDELTLLKVSADAYKDKYIRLSAEFDNYRRRTLNEKIELTKTAGRDILVNILPVVDDFERAMASMKDSADNKSIVDGVELIYNKFKEFLSQKGIKEIDALHTEFDTDLHEALTKIPAPKKKLRGKVVDVIEKGYLLGDKVIRFSKVVIGE